MNPFSVVGRTRLATAVAMSLLLTVPAVAQQGTGAPLPPDSMAETPQAPSDSLPPGAAGETTDNPHEMLPALTGGPDGSPTALRGNPVPGTSTSIPTVNPAPVRPLPERQGQTVTREDTGIQGQCDPVVGLADCPERPPASAEAAGAAGAPASAASDAAVPPASGPTDGGAAGSGGATN